MIQGEIKASFVKCETDFVPQPLTSGEWTDMTLDLACKLKTVTWGGNMNPKIYFYLNFFETKRQRPKTGMPF